VAGRSGVPGRVGYEHDPAVFVRSRLHGFVTLEIAGNFASMRLDPDQLFEIQLATPTT
jgi:WHG domain-containing protein